MRMSSSKSWLFPEVIKFRKTKYMDWDSYERLISAVELFAWQQKVRRSNLRH